MFYCFQCTGYGDFKSKSTDYLIHLLSRGGDEFPSLGVWAGLSDLTCSNRIKQKGQCGTSVTRS